jgi:hypothetical protein
MRFTLTSIATAAILLTIAAEASAVDRPPPPTQVKVTQVEGIDRAWGAFILEWSPAIDAATGKPYAKYMLSSGCKYEGIEPGTQAGPTGVSGLWSTTQTGPRFRLKVTCSCVVGPYRYNAMATAGTNPYMPNSIWVNTEKFLIPCAGKNP